MNPVKQFHSALKSLLGLSCFILSKDILPPIVIAYQCFVSQRLLHVGHRMFEMTSLETSTHYQTTLSSIL